MLVIFDLDGTLANCFERVYSHLACPERGYPYTRRDMDWASFFDECHLDLPMKHTIAVLNAMDDARHDVRIWTGRSEAVREKTVDWLCKHGVSYRIAGYSMTMRPVGDHRDDDILKASWIEEQGRPDLVFEDRARVVRKWRSLGIPCFHVADGDF